MWTQYYVPNRKSKFFLRLRAMIQGENIRRYGFLANGFDSFIFEKTAFFQKKAWQIENLWYNECRKMIIFILSLDKEGAVVYNALTDRQTDRQTELNKKKNK